MIDFDAAVSEGKEILARAEGDQMRLAELADGIEPRYGDQTLERFAREIGVAACTLKRRRSVYRAWKDIGAPAPQCYAVAQELATHPDRANIIRTNPDITKRQARQIMRERQRAEVVAAPRDWRRNEWRRWFQAVVQLATKAIRDGAVADQPVAPEVRQILREVIEPHLLQTLRDGGEALIRLADFLEALIAEPEETTQENATAEAAE
jgi:hypothetical protein